MRNVILGTVAGLILGTAGALAYSHYLGDGQLVADLQAQLDAAKASLAKATQDKQLLAKENSSISEQVDHLLATNNDLKQQTTKSPTPTVTAQPLNPMTLASMVMGMFRGAGFQGQQRLFLLQSRLHLTPDQATAIKAAMEADGKARRAVMEQLFRNNGKVDPKIAAAANTLQQTLATVLTPDQQAAYQQVQADEQASRADTTATVQVDQMAPLLQLSDSQRDQVMSALYQVQMAQPDPTSLMTNPNVASIIASQAQATQDALAKVLTPAQMTLYQQQAQAMPAFGGMGRRGGGNGGGTGNANSGGGTAISGGGPTTSGYVTPSAGTTPVYTTVAPQQVMNTPAATTTAPVTGSTPATDPGSNGASGPASATPSATTNAAPSQ